MRDVSEEISDAGSVAKVSNLIPCFIDACSRSPLHQVISVFCFFEMGNRFMRL